MTSQEVLPLVVCAVVGLALVPVFAALFRAVTVVVDDEEVVLVTRFGKLELTLTKAGLHFLPSRLFPWVKTLHVSLRRDFRHFKNVHVNDARGTTVVVDLWLEFRIEDPARAMFQVADWDSSLHNLVSHAATSILGNRDFRQILCDRTELGEVLQRDIRAEVARWGLKIELVFIRDVSLLPEVSRQIFETIAARLERAKADIDEAGRLRVDRLEADTSVRVATLVSKAKGQYPEAVARAFATIGASPKVFRAYNELYELSLVRPHRTVAFRGFGEFEVKAIEAAMVTPPLVTDGAGNTPALPAHGAAQSHGHGHEHALNGAGRGPISPRRSPAS